VARDLLAKFVVQRPDDRFGLMFFSTKPLSVVSFTQHDAVVQTGIAAADVGRGLANTEVGRALLAAISEFDHRVYSGSRIILLVSDGGAYLDQPTKQRILAGLARNRIALYWIYLRSYNSPTLEDPQSEWTNAPEIALHKFFQTLRTPYRAYQAEVPEDLAKAVADVGRQQNFPLDFLEDVPRQDLSRRFIVLAAICCALLLLGRSLTIRGWI
jgi:mxaC protein